MLKSWIEKAVVTWKVVKAALGRICKVTFDWLRMRLHRWLGHVWLWCVRRFLARCFWKHEQFLSNIVKRELVPYRKTLETKKYWSEARYLHVVGFIPFSIVLVLVLLSKFGSSSVNDLRTARLVLAIYAIGGIVAALTGMLIAIIAFAAQINSRYISGSESLFKQLISSTGYKPVVVLAIGTVAGALVGCVFDGSEPHWIVCSAVAVLVFFGVITVAAEASVLFQAVDRFGRKATITLFTQNFKKNHRESFLVEIKRRIAVNVFASKLREMGFDWNIFEREAEKGQVIYGLNRPNKFFSDAYFGPLERLASMWQLKPISDEKDYHMALVMSGEQNVPIIPIYPGQPSEEEPHFVALIAAGSETDAEIQLMVEEAFVCSKKSPFEDVKVEWDDLANMIRSRLREQNSRELEEILEGFLGIAKDYLRCLAEMKIKHSERSWLDLTSIGYQPPTIDAIGFREIVINATEIKDRQCLEVLYRFIGRLAAGALRVGKDLEYYGDALRGLAGLYYHGVKNIELYEDVKRLTAESLRSAGYSLIRDHIRHKEKNAEDLSYVFDYVRVYYTKLCDTLLRAGEVGDAWTFEQLLDQLNSSFDQINQGDAKAAYNIAKSRFAHFKKNSTVETEQGQDAHHKLELARMNLKIQDLQHLSVLAVSAWLVELVQVEKLNPERAKPLIDKGIGCIEKFSYLVEGYLYADSFSWHKSPLGYDWWDHVQRIPGKPYSTRPAFEGWLGQFWILVALKRVSQDPKVNVDVKKIRLLSAFRDYHYERLENGIKTILDSKDKYKWLAEDVDLDSGREKLLEIFREIKELQKKKDFSELISAPVSQKKVDKFKRDCLKGYLGERKITDLVKEFKCQKKKEVVSWSGKAFVVDVSDKEEFIEDWHVGYGGREANGDFLGQIETRNFSCWIEKKLPELGTVNNFTELPSRVKEVADKLRKKGFKPTVVLIPEDHRYQDTFTSTPDWERMSEYMKNDLPKWVAEFDDMQVFIWPRCEQECIAVIDIDKFLIVEEDTISKYAPLEIQLKEISKERMHKLLEQKDNSKNKQLQKEFEVSGSDIDSFARIKLDLKITANVRLGIVEAGAGSKLTLGKNSIGVVCDKEKMICHTLDCPLVTEIVLESKEMKATAAFAWRGYHFRPCDECRPLFGR